MLGVVQSVLNSSRPSRSENLRRTVGRYHYRIRNRVWRLASQHEHFADLLESDPAAAVAIVSRSEKDPIRQKSMALVESGAPLARIAETLSQPLWLRRLPPEAFGMPLDHGFSSCWHDSQFAKSLLNAMPPEPALAARWLQAVIAAEQVGDRAFVTWLAAQKVYRLKRMPSFEVLPLAMYAWYSTQPSLPCGQIVSTVWNDKMSLPRAASLARAWVLRGLQDFCLDPENFQNSWCRSRVVGSHEIVPLITASSLHDESIFLRNCLHRYVLAVASGKTHIFSIRQNGARLAAMEVKPSETTGMPRIAQICGLANTRASQESIDAAAMWLMLQLRDTHGLQALAKPQHSELLFQRDVWGPFERARRSEIGDCFRVKSPSWSGLLSASERLGTLEGSP